jgi:hypothetical protein
MSDPLSIAASIAGLLSITLEVTKLFRTQIATLSNAPNEAVALVERLETLLEVLQFLSGFAGKNSEYFRNSGQLADITLLVVTERCGAFLAKIKARSSKMDKGGLSAVKQRVLWYFDRDLLVEAETEAQRFITIFAQCKSFEGMYVVNLHRSLFDCLFYASLCSSVLLKSTAVLIEQAKIYQAMLNSLEESHRGAVEMQVTQFNEILQLLRAASVFSPDTSETRSMVSDLHRKQLGNCTS